MDKKQSTQKNGFSLFSSDTKGGKTGIDRRIELLQKNPVFQTIRIKYIKRLAGECVERTFRSSEIIMREGEVGLGLYVIVSGKVKVTINNEKGIFLESDSIIGELSLIDGLPRSATITAEEDTKCLLLTRESFNKISEKHPEIPCSILPLLAKRFRSAEQNSAELRKNVEKLMNELKAKEQEGKTTKAEPASKLNMDEKSEKIEAKKKNDDNDDDDDDDDDDKDKMKDILLLTLGVSSYSYAATDYYYKKLLMPYSIY
jgi:CRP-like cAMP-binding protein